MGAASVAARECTVFGQWTAKVKASLAPLTYPGTPKRLTLTVTSIVDNPVVFISRLNHEIRSY